MKRILFSLFLVFSFTYLIWAIFEPKEYGLAINLASRQRMLTQKMVKNVVLLEQIDKIVKMYEGLAGK